MEIDEIRGGVTAGMTMGADTRTCAIQEGLRQLNARGLSMIGRHQYQRCGINRPTYGHALYCAPHLSTALARSSNRKGSAFDDAVRILLHPDQLVHGASPEPS